MKRYSWTFLLLPLMAGCSERTPTRPIMRTASGDAAAIPNVRFDATAVADQASIRSASNAAPAGSDVSALISSIPKSKYAAASAPSPSDKSDSDDEDDSGETTKRPKKAAHKGGKKGSKGDAADLKGGTASDMSGGTSGDSDAAESESGDVENMLRKPAKPEVKELPKNPSGRPSQGVEIARKAAVEAAKAQLIKEAMQLKLGGDETLGQAMMKNGGQAAMKPGAIQPPGIRIVAYKWNDADHLEAEVEVNLGDLLKPIGQLFPKIDLEPIKLNGEDQCLPAKGVGVIPMGMRSGNKAMPGERAKEAAGGMGDDD